MDYSKPLEEAKRLNYNIRIAAKIKNDIGSVLLIKRSDNDNYSGVWEIPGGAVEPGESLKQALQREVNEETGFRVKEAPKFIKFFDFHNIETDKTTRKFCFEVKVTGNIAISFEHQNFKWFSRDELNNLKVQGTSTEYDIWPDHFNIASQD